MAGFFSILFHVYFQDMYCRTCHIHLQHTYYAKHVSKYCTFKYTRKPPGEVWCLCVRACGGPMSHRLSLWIPELVFFFKPSKM